MTAAVERTGDLFVSAYDFYLWMVLLGGEDFEIRLRAVKFQILPVVASSTSTASDLRLLFERTRRILGVHADGLALVSIMNRARPCWAGDHFYADWKDVAS